MQIKGAHVYVTGANRGIGLGLAEMFAREGAHVHLLARKSEEELVVKMKSLGAASAELLEMDLSSRESVDRLLEQIKDQPIDIWVNNAGQLTGGLLEEQSVDDIYSMFQVNLLSLVQITRGLIPQMIARGKGLIVNNSSVSALMHFPCASTYAASKAAVWAFTDCLQTELKGTGVSTLCLITPGIKTRMFDEIEVKYGKNFEVPTDSITPEQYADWIKEAILKDESFVLPRGATAFGLGIARYFPFLFKKEISRRFDRQGL